MRSVASATMQLPLHSPVNEVTSFNLTRKATSHAQSRLTYPRCASHSHDITLRSMASHHASSSSSPAPVRSPRACQWASWTPPHARSTSCSRPLSIPRRQSTLFPLSFNPPYLAQPFRSTCSTLASLLIYTLNVSAISHRAAFPSDDPTKQRHAVPSPGLCLQGNDVRRVAFCVPRKFPDYISPPWRRQLDVSCLHCNQHARS